MKTKGCLVLLYLLICLNSHLCDKEELGPFVSKEKAASYLQGRSKRVKRGINEECSETGGCSYEEIREIGVSDVCAWMKNRLCNELNCAPGYICVTTLNDCSKLHRYGVGCEEIDECASNPCQNGGTCSDNINSFSCSCPEHVHGTMCENEYPKLSHSPLSSTCSCYGTNCGIGSIVEQQMCTKVDILFLIDDSSSVSYSGFTYAKSVAAKLVDCLTIGPNDVRVGMMTFGSTVSTRFTFSQFFDKNQIKSTIVGSSYRGEIRTYTNIPLQNALPLMTSNQADTLDIVIVLTDGKSNSDVWYASQVLHSAGVYTFAMGIGLDLNSNNLETIARNPNTDYHVSTNDYTDLHRKVSKLINGLCTGYSLPDILTCEMEIQDSFGEKVHSPTNGSSHCLNQQHFYGKYQPEFIFTDVMIDGENKGFRPTLPYSDFHFGVATAHVELLKRTKSGTDVAISRHAIKVSSDYQRLFSRLVNLTNSVKFSDSERLCLKYDAEVGGNVMFESKTYHYGRSSAQRTLCYFYDDQAPRHCSDLGTCTYSPLQLDADITNDSTLIVSFPGWKDVDTTGTASIFASGISHLEITLHEMEYSNGMLKMKHASKIPKTVCHNCSNILINIPNSNDPILYGVAVEVVDVALNSRQARRFVLYDASSKLKIHENYDLWVTSAYEKTNFLWQTNHDSLCYNWTNRYYNDKFVHYNPLSPIDTGVHNHFTGVYEQTTGKFPVTGTTNIHGITSFRYTIQKDLVDMINDQLTPNFPEENICVPVSGVNDGNTITFEIGARDIIGHEIKESVVHHIDSSPPVISNAWLIRDGTREIFVHNAKDLSAMKLQFKAFDVHSGLVSVHWSIRNEDDNAVFGNGALGVYSIANCAISKHCYCPSIGECQLMNYTLVMNSLVVNDTHIGEHHRKYVIELEVVNHAALRTTESVTILVDESAPETGVIREGSQGFSDIDYISEPNITISWRGFIDHESGIKFYRLGLSNSCLSLEELWHPNSSKVEYHDTEELSMHVLISSEEKMYSSVIAFNNAMEPSKVGCSDGILVDRTPPIISNVSIKNLRINPSIGCADGSFWYVNEELIKTKVACNNTCSSNDPLINVLPENMIKSKTTKDVCLLPAFTNEYLYIGNDLLDISWNISDIESQIQEVFIGIGSSQSSILSPDISGYSKTHHNTFYRLQHSGLAGNGIVFVFIKAVNKANKETAVAIGPIIVDETPPLCLKKPTTDLTKDLVIVSWSTDYFEDNQQIGNLKTIYYRLVSKGSMVRTDFVKWTNHSLCPNGRYCVTFPLSEIQHIDMGSGRVYQVEFHAYNDAGHFCDILSQDIILPSPFLPTRGMVYDIDVVSSEEDAYVEDIDASFTLDSFCVYLKGIHHLESLIYELGVGLSKASDDVISLHHVNVSFFNNGAYFCENTSKLKPYQKYFALLKASSSGGSITLSSDGFVKINKKDFDHFLKTNDGPGCTSTNLVLQENLVLRGTNFILNTSLPLVIGSVYTAFVNASADIISVKGEEASIISKSYNSFTFMPLSHLPVFTISVSLTDLKSNVVDLFRCEEDVDIQDQFTDIGANLFINSTLDHHISQYELSLMSCGSSMNGVCNSVISKRVGKQKHYMFTEVHNILTEGYYKILLRVCFRSKCIPGGYSDGFYLESNDPEFGSFSAELDSASEECVDIQLHFQEFRCSYPLDTFAKFYRWAIFTDGDDADGSIQLTDYKIQINNTREIRTCISMPGHPHRALRACLEGYCRSGKVSKTCTFINVIQDPNYYNKGVVYDLDARSEFFSALDAYKYTRNIGNKLKELHTNEINYRAQLFRPGAFIIGVGKTINVWCISKSALVPMRSEEDDSCLELKRETGGLVKFSSNLPMEYNTMYYICVNITSNVSSSQCSNGFIIDRDPPSKGEVYVKTKTNGYITEDSRLDIHWHGFTDDNKFRNLGYPSSIQFYEIAIGTKKETGDVLTFQNVGLLSAISISNTSLVGGTSYYFSVKAHDHAGNYITGSSKPYIFDKTPPTHGDVYVGYYLNHKSYVKPSRLLVQCIGFLDHESGIEKFEIGVGSTKESADVFPLFDHHYTNTPIEVPAHNTLFDGHVYYIIVVVWNYAGVSTSGFSNPFIFDSSPPEKGVIREGRAHNQRDEDYTTDSTVHIHWTEFVDKHSPIDYYRIGLGSGVGLLDIHNFVYIGKKQEWAWTLSFIPGKRYFSTVEGCNMAGLCSQASSNGIVIDSSPPVPGFVSIGAENVKYIPQRSSLSLEWGNFADIQSGIVHYEICVGTSKLNCNILRWKNVRLEQTALLLNLALPTNQDLYAVVKATNRVGLSTQQTSHSFRVDDTPPTVTKLPRFISSEDASSIYDSSVVRVEWGFDDKESPIKMTLLSLRLQDGAHSEIDNIVVNSKDMFVKSLSSKEWLKDGDSYYVVVTSCNMAGLCESIKSKTVVFDGTPPIHGHVLDGGTWSNANSTIILKWKSYDDPESGINSYFITIGKTHNGMEISRGIVNVVHYGDENSIQTGVFNISELIKSGDKIVFSIWARNKASLNGTIRRLTFIAVSNDQNNTGGNLIVERHSCSVSYCTNECTCTILGGKCNHIQNTHECTISNNSQMSVNSKIALRILGSPSDDWTSSTRCLGVEWHSQNITVLRYEWSIGLNHMPYGYGIFDTTIEQIWHDISLQTRVVHCLPNKRQLLHGRQYVAYLRTWITENEYILTQSKPIIIDTTPPSIRRGRFIIDSDAECIRDKEFTNNKDLKTCWKGVFADEQSGIKEFRIMIGVSPGGHEISGIQSVGLATDFSWNFPDLEPGVRYYSSVEAVNFVGQSTTLTSDGITIDSTPPDAGIVFTTKFFHNERWLKNASTISASWEGFTDFESSIDHFILSVIDAYQNVIVQDLNVGFLNKYTITDLLLVHGMSYFINVRAVDMSGHSSNISTSEAITVDKTMPEGLLCKTFLEHSNVTTKILTNQKQVIKDVFRLNHSTLYKVVIDGELDIDIQDMVIDIDGNLYEVALNEQSSEISFMSKTSTSDIGVYVNSPQNQSLSLRITVLECKVSEIGDIEALAVRQISPNFLTIAANVMDKESEIRHVEMYFGTHSRGRQLKTIKATSPFTIHKVFMPISHGTTLHISAMAENNAGFKKYFYSNAIVWDHTPPNLHIKNVSVTYIDENGDTLTLITIDWKLDETESEVAYCQCAFGNEVASQNLQNWEMSRDFFSCQSKLSIPHGSNVFPSVQCFNRVGLQTVVNRNLPVVVSFDSPRPLSKDVHFVVNSVKVQNSVNVQQISTTLYFHWPVFSDISGISEYSVCIKSDNLVVYDWQGIGRHNYFSAEEILLATTRNYTVLVSGTNVGGRTSDPINGSISVINVVPVQTGNSCLANETINGNVLVTWTDVFSLTTEMEPYYIVYLGSNVGFSDLLQNYKTSNTEYLLSTKPRQVYAVITAKYATGSESTYRELININNF